MKTLFAACIPLFLFVLGRGPIQPEGPVPGSSVPLQGTRWNLVKLSGQVIPVNATSKNRFLILKNDSTVTGNGGCNAFSGKYSLGKGNQIAFGDMVRTNVLCSGIDFERKYINALARVNHYSLQGDTLVLQSDMVNLASFVPSKP